MSPLAWTEIVVIVTALAAIALINWYFLPGSRAASRSGEDATDRSSRRRDAGGRAAADGGEG